MSKYLNSPREADWYACPSCGDEVRVGSSGCRRCNAFAEDPGEAAEKVHPAGDADDFNYDDWSKKEFGTLSRFKPHHLAWKYWIGGLLVLLAMLFGALFLRH